MWRKSFTYTDALARVQRVHEPIDLWDITFLHFWNFLYYMHAELSSIEQAAPADPNS